MIVDKLRTVAENVDRVFRAGVNVGYGEGYEAGSAEGVKLPTIVNNASPSDIRLNREAIDADGKKIVGTMPEHRTVSTALDVPNNIYRVQTGFHEGCLVTVSMEGLIKAKADKDVSVIVKSPTNKFMTAVEIEPATDVYGQGLVDGEGIGITKGYDMGVTEGKANGAVEERSAFWNAFQENGERTNYDNAFYRWNDENFYPKYDLTVSNCQYMFWGSSIQNLKQRLIDCGVTLNTSGSTALYTIAQSSKITHFPELGGNLVTNIQNAFNGCKQLISIDKLILSTSANCSCTNAFRNASELAEIRFNEGIRPTSLDMKTCIKLSADSINNLLNSVADDFTTTVTLSETAVVNAFGLVGTDEWIEYWKTQKPNLTITLG